MPSLDATTGKLITDRSTEIEQRVLDRLFTMRGSWDYLPRYGTLLPRFYAYPVDDVINSVYDAMDEVPYTTTTITRPGGGLFFRVEVLADGTLMEFEF